MKTSSEKSSTTTSTTSTQASNQPFFAKAGGGSFFAPVSQTAAPAVQMKMAVNQPGDPFEREADRTADRVMRMPTPAESALQRQTNSTLQRKDDEKLQKAPASKEKLQRDGSGAPNITGATQSSIQSQTGGGQPLSSDVRGFMEPRFNADFSNVRVHSDPESASLSNQLSARAFTYQNHIFFSRDQYQPGSSEGRQLLAHELTHTIQQGHAVQRSPQVSTTVTPPAVQRLGLNDILDGLAELAANLPGFNLLTQILGRNPITQRVVERNVVSLLLGFIRWIPGVQSLIQALNRSGILQRFGDWMSRETARLGLGFQSIRDAFVRFTNTLRWRDIFSPGDVWRRAQTVFTPPIRPLIAFADALTIQAIAWLKETFLQPLSNFCREIPAYPLVTVLLGRDPFTNAPVPRTPLNLVRAFAAFIPGGTEKVNQLVESGALQRAHDWYVAETQARNLTLGRFTGIFTQAWNALHLTDVLSPIETFGRIRNLFRPPLGDLESFAGAAGLKVLELIFEALMSRVGAAGRRVVGILSRSRSTFNLIINAPVPFLSYLVHAVGQGFRQFGRNILRHLEQGVIAWLSGPVARAGIQMPEHWDLRGLVGFVLQILGLTWPRIREKLVRLMGERPVAALETAFELVQQIRQRGIAQALRERETEFFGQLPERALGSIRTSVQERIVGAAVAQVASLLTPVGAVIQAIVKTYTTFQFFHQRSSQILDVVESVENSVPPIASGNTGSAANYIENSMVRSLPVFMDFSARFIGLGDVGGLVQRAIRQVQEWVDQRLDRVVEWIRDRVRSFAQRVAGGTPQQRLDQALNTAQIVVNRFAGRRVGISLLRPLLGAIRLRYQLQSLELVARGDHWAVRGVANPEAERVTGAQVESDDGQSMAVKARAAMLLEQQILETHSMQDVSAVLARTLVQLSSQGLRSLVLGRTAADGSIPVLAEASERLPIGNVKPKDVDRPPDRHVTAYFEIRLIQSLGVAREGIPTFTNESNPTYQPQVKRGGQVLQTDLQAPLHSDRIQGATWNTSPIRFNERVRSNESHAERQLFHIITERHPEWIPLMRAIVVRMDQYSPCAVCSNTLRDLILVINQRRREQDLRPINSARLYWSTLYGGESMTTWQGIREMSSEGWEINAPPSAWPPEHFDPSTAAARGTFVIEHRVREWMRLRPARR